MSQMNRSYFTFNKFICYAVGVLLLLYTNFIALLGSFAESSQQGLQKTVRADWIVITQSRMT